MQRRRDAELEAVLSPEEMEEFQLRHSGTAREMRSRLGDFRPSEEEFRRIFRLQKSFDDEIVLAFDGLEGEQVAEIRAQVMADGQAALDEELKQALGDKRFAEYHAMIFFLDITFVHVIESESLLTRKFFFGFEGC